MGITQSCPTPKWSDFTQCPDGLVFYPEKGCQLRDCPLGVGPDGECLDYETGIYFFGDEGFQSQDCAHGVASDGTCLAHEKGVYFFDNEFQRRDCKHGVALDGTCMENKTKESGLYYYDDVLKTLTLAGTTRKAAEGENCSVGNEAPFIEPHCMDGLRCIGGPKFGKCEKTTYDNLFRADVDAWCLPDFISRSMECVAHHGSHTPSDGSTGNVAGYTCPSKRPTCQGYEKGVKMGKCVAILNGLQIETVAEDLPYCKENLRCVDQRDDIIYESNLAKVYWKGKCKDPNGEGFTDALGEECVPDTESNQNKPYCKHPLSCRGYKHGEKYGGTCQ